MSLVSQIQAGFAAVSTALKGTNTNLSAHTTNYLNPHQVTAAQVGTVPMKILASTDPLPSAPSAPVVCLRMST